MNAQEHERIAEEAARWFARLRGAGDDPKTLAAFRRWRDESLAHRRAFAQFEDIWAELDGLVPVETPAGARLRGGEGSRRRRRLVRGLAAAAAVLLLGLGAGLHALGEAPWQWRSLETSRGEQRTLMLADGSTVYLNTATRLSVRMTDHRRILRLHTGEALFEVTHDPTRPFVVETPLGRVRVVGTRFDVALAPHEQKMRVVVVEGKVELTPERRRGAPVQPLALTPGEVATVAEEGVSQRREADAARLISWRDGFLVFDGSPLRRVVDDLNRYLAHPIRIADAEAGELRVTAVIRLEDREAIVNALTAALPVRALTLDNGTVLLFADREEPPS